MHEATKDQRNIRIHDDVLIVNKKKYVIVVNFVSQCLQPQNKFKISSNWMKKIHQLFHTV